MRKLTGWVSFWRMSSLAAGLLAVIAVVLRAVRRTHADGTQQSAVMRDPKEILFSLPTLFDPLPDGEKAERLPADAFHLHEDDWRQIEFIGPGEQDEVEAELAQLRGFIAQHRKGYGFRKVHVRHSRPESLAPFRIDADALKPLLPPKARRKALVVGAAPWGPSVVSGYAIEIGPDAVLYVQVVGKHLATIGLPLSWRKGASPEADEVLVTISRALKLRLVHWPAAGWVHLA